MTLSSRYLECTGRLLAAGCEHNATSESGSRYFVLPSGQHVRVADHTPNRPTYRWILREGVSSVRVDQPSWRSQLLSIVGPLELPIDQELRDLSVYHGDDTHESQSRLKVMDESPLKYHGMFIAKNIRDKDTPDKKLGRCVHVKVLQPHLFNLLCPVMPQFEHDPENVTKAGKPPSEKGRKSTDYYQCKKAEFEVANFGRDVIDDDQLDQINGMANAIWRHEAAHEILSESEENEIIHRWHDRIPRRGMFDAPRPTLGLIADVKTMTGPPTPLNFARNMARWGYYIQRPWYLRGMADRFGPYNWRFVFICVNKNPPHEVALHELSNKRPEDQATEALRLAKPWMTDLDLMSDAEWSDWRTERLVDELIDRRETNNWHAAWEHGINCIPLPKTARSRFYDVEDSE